MCSNIQIMALLITSSRSVSLFSSSFFIVYHLCLLYLLSSVRFTTTPSGFTLHKSSGTYSQAVCHFLVTDTIAQSEREYIRNLCMDLCLFAYDYDGRISCHRKQKTRSKRTLLDMFAEDGAILYGTGNIFFSITGACLGAVWMT